MCIIVARELSLVKKNVVFCNVYASNNEVKRRSLWNFLKASQISLPVPWCLGGDFNTILDPSERREGIPKMGSIRSFNDFILGAKVIDLLVQEDKEMMEDARVGWSECLVSGSYGFKLFSNLKAVKMKLKAWQLWKKRNSSSFKALEDKLARVDNRVVTDGWSLALREEQLAIILEMWK
ncbi:hypothetical protein LWI28_002710 [Acer negundo]|uniref:Reverse transcriptase n=1 Tax=Acer negundo TaxID=4023 RepID=A0AAD5JGL1_ACENE|nr:hypothetical protein LWI28_002710 [Acer negundo]